MKLGTFRIKGTNKEKKDQEERRMRVCCHLRVIIRLERMKRF